MKGMVKMKIGIMSMQRIRNYGSFMQAYCLKRILEQNGNEVKFVDFHIEEPISNELNVDAISELPAFELIKKKINSAKFALLYNYIWLPKYLRVKKEKCYNPKIDKLIIGSDEVFNCTQSSKTIGYSKELFGYGRKNVLTYAASFGYTTKERLEKYKIDHEISEMLKRITKISVRDKNSYNIVNALTKIKPEINLDPVLVSDLSKTNLPKVKNKDYIIVYSYCGRITDKESDFIKAFANKHNKKIISLGYYNQYADKNIVTDPFKMLAYFKNADYVITDTFHGSIFSIIYEKKFVTLVRKTNQEKLDDLLERLKLNDRKIYNLNDLEVKFNEYIDYNKVNEILNCEKEHTLDYLKSNL